MTKPKGQPKGSEDQGDYGLAGGVFEVKLVGFEGQHESSVGQQEGSESQQERYKSEQEGS